MHLDILDKTGYSAIYSTSLYRIVRYAEHMEHLCGMVISVDMFLWMNMAFVSLRTGYRLFHRLMKCQSILRTKLLSRSPPLKKKSAGSPLLQMFKHLQEAFGAEFITEYQQKIQKDFLTTS